MREADYPFHPVTPKYLGSTVNNFRKRSRGGEEAKPTQAFQKWFNKLAEVRDNELAHALESSKMLLPPDVYTSSNAPTSQFLMEIGSLDGLIATAQELAKPVFAIDIANDTSFGGAVGESYVVKIADIDSGFRAGAEKVIALTSQF